MISYLVYREDIGFLSVNVDAEEDDDVVKVSCLFASPLFPDRHRVKQTDDDDGW